MSDPDQQSPDVPLPPGVVREASTRELLAEILSAAPGLTVQQIVDRAYDDGWDLGDDPVDEFEVELYDDEQPYFPFGLDRWVHIPSLLTGRTFTHRLTQSELDHDVLPTLPDFDLLQILVEYGYHGLVGGGEAAIARPESRYRPAEVREVPDEVLATYGSFVLPTGTLAGFEAGALVGLRYGPDGIDVLAVDEPETATDLLRDHLLDGLTDNDPQEIDNLMVGALVDVPGVFSEPLPPVTELIEAWGIASRDDGLLAEPGFDWSRWHPYATTLAARYDLSEEEADAAATVLAYIASARLSAILLRERIEEQGLESGPADEDAVATMLDEVSATTDFQLSDPEELVRSLDFLAEPHIAYVILDEALRPYLPGSGVALLATAQGLLEVAPRSARGALHWLEAKAYERTSDIVRHEEALRQAERLDPGFYPALADLARLAADRGDAATARALLDRVPTDAARLLRSTIPESTPQPTQIVPRNAPCWCGSGRKFKACHLRQSGHRSLGERADWLYAKAVVFAIECGWQDLAGELADTREAYITSSDELRDLQEDGLVFDVVLFEGGALGAFVRSRGQLLPADELLLAQQWLLTARSAYEVVEVVAGDSVTFRDLRTGDTLRSANRLASTNLTVGQLVCAHLLPHPDGDHTIQALDPIRLHERPELLELLDDEETDPEDLVAFLSRRLAPPHELTGGYEIVSASSEPLSLDRGGSVTAQHRSSGRGTVGAFGQPLSPGSDALEDDPAVRAAVAEHMRGYEERWLDLDIPALDGFTPRQAAADPTRRDDLIRLIASFPEATDNTQMDPHRLRTLLGLT